MIVSSNGIFPLLPTCKHLLIIIDLNMEMGHDYIEAYHKYGKDILISPLHAKLKPKIIS